MYNRLGSYLCIGATSYVINKITNSFDVIALCTMYFWMRDKTAVFKMGQNRRFWKWDKIAHSENETKSPILWMRQNRRLLEREKIADW